MHPVVHSARPVQLRQRANRGRLAKMLVKLFEHWELPRCDQASLLGLSPASPATIARCRRGEPLANNADLLARAGHLLGIHNALRITFAHDVDLAYRWVRVPNRRFGGQAPINTMKMGFEGLLAVRRYLDFERGR